MTGAIITINCDKDANSDYLLYFINSIKDVSDEVFLCVSQNIDKHLLEKLQIISKNIFSYSTYIDINRWKDVLLNKLDITKYDYLLFANDSSYGPIYSLKEVMNDMYVSSAQLWGISSHGRMEIVEGKKRKVWPRFIQTHFFVLKRQILLDERFTAWLKKLPYYRNFQKASEGFEFSFTKIVEDWGYSWDTLVETKQLENDKYFMSFILFDIYRLISKEKYPFLPKVIFDLDNSVIRNFNAGYDIGKVLEYIKHNTNYDVNLILDDLISRKDPSDLLESVNLYRLGKYSVQQEKSMRCAVFAYLFYDDLFAESLDYIFNVPDYVDIYVASDTEAKANKIKNYADDQGINNKVTILTHNNKGRDLSALLVLFKPYVEKYDLFCFIHDKKSSQMVYSTVGADFNTHMWQSLLGSRQHIEGIINEFVDDEKLGLLAPKMITHGMYFHTAIDSWTICYDKTMKLMEQYDIHATVNGKNNPLAMGSAFWARSDALLKLFSSDIKYDDFPDEPLPVDGSFSHCIERIFPYVVSDGGYYSGIIMNKEVALNEVNNNTIALNQIMRRLDRYAGVDTATLHTTLFSAENLKLKKKKYDKIFKDSRNMY